MGRDCCKTAMDLLARREHSRLELHRKLAGRHFPEIEIEASLDRLEDDRLLDDRRFAEAFARQRVGRGCGPVRIVSELRERGVEGALIGAVLDDYSGQWVALAREQWIRKFGTPAEDYKGRARQMRFLRHRGFGFDVINEVFRTEPL